MEYKDPKDALKTREENGFRIALNDDTFRFPTEESLKAALMRVNEMARNHEMQVCPAGQECRICFLTKASAESEVLNEYVEKTFHAMLDRLGPLAHALVDYHLYFSMMFFFLLLGQEITKGKNGDAPSVEELNKLFGLPASENNSASGDEKAAN